MTLTPYQQQLARKRMRYGHCADQLPCEPEMDRDELEAAMLDEVRGKLRAWTIWGVIIAVVIIAVVYLIVR